MRRELERDIAQLISFKPKESKAKIRQLEDVDQHDKFNIEQNTLNQFMEHRSPDELIATLTQLNIINTKFW